MEDAVEEETKIASLIQIRYLPFILEAIIQVKKTVGEVKKLEILNALYEGLSQPLNKDKVAHFKKNKDLLERLYHKYEKVRDLRQKRNSDKSASPPSEALASSSKLVVGSTNKPEEGSVLTSESSNKDSKMDKAGESSPLQNHMSCKMCAFVGQNLVKHYVEVHPGAEIPVCLTPKELNTLKSNAETPVQQPVDTAVQEDRFEVVINFLNKLGQASTFVNPITCPLCSYSSILKSELVSHLIIHQTSNLKCYFCHVTETNLNDFRDHMSTHTGEYAYQCIHCKFRGASSSDVAHHISQNHPGREAKTIFENVFHAEGGCLKGYVCSTCGFIQMSKQSVEKHVSSVDLFCRGSYVIELDLSKGRKGASTATVIKGNYIPTASDNSEYIIPNSEAQTAGRNTSNIDSGTHAKSIGQNRVYIQDEIEIAPPEPHADSILPFNDDNNQTPPLKIKTEKIDESYNQHGLQSQARNLGNIPSYLTSNVNILPKPPIVSHVGRPLNESIATKMPDGVAEVAAKKTINFTCASCQFNTVDEAQFIKHARTDHRSDLSLWCKNCGKCFSNAGVLVSHIKESACIKEDMIYRCGVKECTFETPSGQTFVHHLRHCHKGSPFIFCVHCQKIFTLPHCLILHMQNDCPYKEKNRRTPIQATSVTAPTPKPIENIAVAAKQYSSRSLLLPLQVVPSVASHVQPDAANKAKVVEPTGRGRGKVKSRGRGKLATDSSDSDPDDPSWMPGDAPPARSLRRTSRASRKSEASDSDQSPTGKGNCGGSFACTCCEFSARSNALLEDHYLTAHKKSGKIGCLICNLKFESTQNFLDHFVLHKKVSAGGKSNSPVVKDESAQKENLTEVKSEPVGKSKTTSVVQIPYQAAIHEKNERYSKLKCFEELKSKEDLTKLKEPVKLKHFFKCMLYSCTFTTDNNSYFISHLNDNHHGKQLHCPFCFEEYSNSTSLTTHMLRIHGKRCYQCSSCFYRAFSKPHVQVHIKNFHSKGKKADVFTCTTHITMNPGIAMEEAKSDVAKTTWPYCCAIGGCKFETYEPNEFKKHNEVTHRAVSVFICSYCKAEFISFKRLMNHYRLHGINNFQCTYCLHGSDTKEEILSHLSQSHADNPIQIHVRAPQESPFSNKQGSKLQSEQITTGVTDSATRLEDQRFQKKYGKNIKTETQVGDPPNLIPKSPICSFNRESSALEKIYPEYIASFEKKFSCGIPNCTKQFETVKLYLKHLKLNHSALNVICPYCFEAVERESDFKDHLLFHGPNLYACGSDICCYNHWDREEVIKHTKSQHEKEPDIVNIREQNVDTPSASIPEIDSVDPKQNIDSKGSLSCPFCNYKTYNRVMMKKHLYIELEYVRFQCVYCKKKCSTRKEVLSHFLSDHPNGSILASVDINAEIEYLVKTYIYCLQNMSSGEPEIEGECKPNFNCSDCRKLFTRARDWHNHLSYCLMQHFVANVLNYVTCSYCKVTCARISALKTHSDILHAGKYPRYTENPNRLEWMNENLVAVRLQFLSFIIGLLIKNCSGLVLNDLQTWQKNYKLESKLYKCVYCSFSNNFRYNVERHLTSSHNDKPIKIERLSKAFFASGPPLNIVCDGDNDDVYVFDDSEISPVCRKSDVRKSKEMGCGICPCEFSCLDNLMQHAVLDHAFQINDTFPYFYSPVSGSNLQNVEKTYCCTYCKSGDMVLPELKLHHDSLHVGLPFKSHGSLTITKNSSLTVKCGHCPETFLTRTAFYKHCKNVHPKFPVKEFSEIASGSQKRKFDSVDGNSASPSLLESSDTTEHVAKKLKNDCNVYICLYCHNIFPSLEKIKAHFIVLHPCLPFKYHGMSVPLKDDVSISFGVTDFLDSSSFEAPTLVPEGEQQKASKRKSSHSNASPFSEKRRLNKITLHLASKFRDRSLKFSVVHLSQKFPLFPIVSISDTLNKNTLSSINIAGK